MLVIINSLKMEDQYGIAAAPPEKMGTLPKSPRPDYKRTGLRSQNQSLKEQKIEPEQLSDSDVKAVKKDNTAYGILNKNLESLKKEQQKDRDVGYKELRDELPIVEPAGPDEPASGTTKSNLPFSIIMAIVVVLVAIFLILANYSSQESVPDHPVSFKDHAKYISALNKGTKIFKMTVKDQQQQLPDSVSKTTSAVNKTIFAFLKEEVHEKPAVILFLGAQNGTCQTCCLLNTFVEALAAFYNENKQETDNLKAAKFDKLTENQAKHLIEKEINHTLQEEGKHWIILNDVDKFPSHCVSKLHPYFDENAPFKDVVFLLTAQTNLIKETSETPHAFAQRHFDAAWEKYPQEHRRALMGRMTSVTALVQPSEFVFQEDNECDSQCPCNSES